MDGFFVILDLYQNIHSRRINSVIFYCFKCEKNLHYNNNNNNCCCCYYYYHHYYYLVILVLDFVCPSFFKINFASNKWEQIQRDRYALCNYMCLPLGDPVDHDIALLRRDP